MSYPWDLEPTAKRSVTPEPTHQDELSAQFTHPWPALPEEPGQEARGSPRTSSESRERRQIEPWPELPEAPPTESPEGTALLLQWERLSRLDREQRGE